ncbi:MAG TPA: hypothetical protein VLA00_16400 [Xanthobacteraceae bacterium]|nr:hypothetical protein [Xanthobacteraceae bacterium]
MPEPEPDALARWIQGLNDAERTGAPARVRLAVSSADIVAADEALAWLGLLRHQHHRLALAAWLRAIAENVSFKHRLAEMGIAYRTGIRHRDDALDAIVDGLNRKKVGSSANNCR